MDDQVRAANEDFENAVRSVARQLWPQAEFSGSAIVDGRETDGIFDTEDCRHFVEATTSRRKSKAEEDITKLLGLIRRYRSKSGTRALRGWFITRDEPTAEQRQVADRHRDAINTLSFAQFRARLVNSNSYLTLRDACAFGSVRDPGTGQPRSDLKYVPLDLVNPGSNALVSSSDVLHLLSKRRTIVLLGDYGAGKSMTLREIYSGLKTLHLRDHVSTFPVFINLREHHGQSEPAEIISRHAQSIGFPNPSHLVRAWRAGYVHLLLDGFDELTALNIQGPWRKLRHNRYRAMEGVRRLIREHPAANPDAPHADGRPRPGLLVAGRAHFFDNPSERRSALGLAKGTLELSLNEFTEQQIQEYLAAMGLAGFLPQWLPSRPLFVGYLAATRLLGDLNSTSQEEQIDPVVGWDILLDRVAAREAEIEVGIDGTTVRRILERLATKARDSQGGLGPLTLDSVIAAFRDVCGYDPDDRAMVLLQRLPGLGVYDEEDKSRIFVDEAFADACRGGDLAAFIENPFAFESSILSRIESAVGSLGIAVAYRKVDSTAISDGKLNTALERAQRGNYPYLVADIARVIINAGFGIRKELIVSDVVIAELELGRPEGDVSRLQFSDCLFGRVELDPAADVANIPAFRGCFIESFEGRLSRTDLPSDKFDGECIVDYFVEAAETTAAVLTLGLPLGTLVCLTVLKKIYERRGSGRRENALYRGLDQRARQLVPEVLQALKAEKLVFPYRRKGETIWLAGRDRRRVGRIIAAPNAMDDPVLQRCEGL